MQSFQVLAFALSLVTITGFSQPEVSRAIQSRSQWHESPQNRRFELYISSASKHDKIAVENRIFKVKELDKPVTWRVAGAWIAADSMPEYESKIAVAKTNRRLYRRKPFSLIWPGKDTVFEIQQGRTHLLCQVKSIYFAASSPGFDGDCDEDGILDSEEAMLAQQNRRIGNPLQKDILLVGAWTHPRWRIRRETVMKMTTVFGRQGVNLLFVAAAGDLPGTSPGLTRAYGWGKRKKWFVDKEYVRRFRLMNDHVPQAWQRFAHLTVFARRATCYGQKVFGCSELPGLVTVVTAKLRCLPPNFFNYQAGTLMHEFGHNLGLCHPHASDNCPTGPLPKSEQDGGATVMGSPADDGGLKKPKAWINALRRPMNYSPTQWKNLGVALAVSKLKMGCK